MKKTRGMMDDVANDLVRWGLRDPARNMYEFIKENCY